MALETKDIKRFSAKVILGFIYKVFIAAGMPEEDSRIVSQLITEADINGCDGHGIFRLPGYIRRIKEGGINLKPNIRIERQKSGMALVDGDNAQGHLVMRFCTELAMKKAKDSGVAWVGVHDSNHAGPAALYTRMPLAHDMIGLYVAIGNANHLPPWGGIEMLLSTNPISIAVPRKNGPPIVLDMATTVAAYGKVKTAAQRGEKIPEGWMIDKNGQPLTDPTKSEQGFLMPIGGPKGYGLALMFGLLAGTLNGAAFGKDVIDFNADFKTPTNTGQFITAIDISAFGDVENFKNNVDNVYRTFKASATLPGYDEVLLPGEQSYKKRQDRTANGVPVHDGLLKSLNITADQLGVDRLE